MPVRAEKDRLRAQYLRLRQAIPPQERRQSDEVRTRRVLDSEAYRNADAILCYVSFGAEADTRDILRNAWRQGKRVAAPRCMRRGEMAFYLIEDMRQLQSGVWGILEPQADCPLYLPQESDLCIVPGLAFDREGFRLGYGGGYYDRYLASHAMRTVGLGFSQFLPERLPREPVDISVQQVIC